MRSLWVSNSKQRLASATEKPKLALLRSRRQLCSSTHSTRQRTHREVHSLHEPTFIGTDSRYTLLTLESRNSQHLTVIINGMSAEVPKPDISVTIEAQMQHQADSNADPENRLVIAVRSLNCELQKLRFAQAISTAQYNGWLAAAQ